MHKQPEDCWDLRTRDMLEMALGSACLSPN